MLEPFGDEIWIADGAPVIAIAGFHYPTRMAVIRLADGGLFVWSPVGLTDALHAAVAALGPVRCIVAPNALHHTFLSEWAAAHPSAALYAAPALRAARTDIAFTAELANDAPPVWAGQIEQAIVRNTIADEVVFFHRASGTALFTDLLQQMPRGWYKGWRALVARLDRMTGSEPQTPNKFRMAVRDRAAARESLARIRGWPARRVLMAHGEPVREDGAAFIARAFAWLER